MRSHCPLPNSYWRGGRTRGYCKAKRTFLARKTKLANRLSLKISQWLIGHFLKIGLISGFVFFICVFSKQLMVNKIGDDWIRTADLRCRKRPRYTDQFLLAVTWSTAAYRTLRLVSAQVVSYCVYELTKQ